MKGLPNNGQLQNITTAVNLQMMVFDVADIPKIEHLMNLCHSNGEMKTDSRANIRHKNGYARSLEETITISYRCIILQKKKVPLDYLQK